MAKQIKRSEIAEKDLYLDIRESAELTITKIDDLNESLSKTATTVMNKLKKPLDETVEGLNDVEESVDAMNKTLEASIKLDKAKAEALQTQRKAEQELEKINQEALKTQQQQLKLEAQELKMAAAKKKADETELRNQDKKRAQTKEGIRDAIKLQRAKAEDRKLITDTLILENKESGTLEKLAARNRILRREREKLNLETEEGRQALKKINEELDENNDVIKENSDRLKQQKLNVGNYTESITKALGPLGGFVQGVQSSIKALKTQVRAFRIQSKAADTSAKKMRLVGKAIKGTGIGLLIALLGSVVAAFGDTRAEAKAMQNSMKMVTNSIKLIGNAIIGFFDNIGLKFKRFTKFLELGIAQVKNTFGTNKEEVQKLSAELDELDKKIEANTNVKIDFSSFSKMAETVNAGSDALINFENSLATTNQEIERLRGQEELLGERTGDMTLSFQDQLAAQNELNRVTEKRLGLEKDLAAQNVDVQALKIREQLIVAGKNYSLEQIKNLEFLQSEDAFMKINSDSLAELRDAKTEQIEKENELNTLQSKIAMERRNTLKDLFEKELDYAIDSFDVNKTVNERIINLEKTTLAERERLTEDTRRLSDSAFENQIKLVEDYTGKQIDFDALVKESDESKIRSMLREKNLNETTLTRILEIIKERKIVLQDLTDLELENGKKRIEMNNAINESINNIRVDDEQLDIEIGENELEKEIALRQEAFDKNKKLGEESVAQLKKRVDDITNLKKDALRNDAAFEKEQIKNSIMEEDVKAAKIKEINEKLENDLIRLDMEGATKKAQIDENEIKNEESLAAKKLEIEQQRVNDQIAILQMLTNASNELADRRIAKIDEEIEASQRRYDNFQALAEAGNITAAQSMAEESKLIAEQNRLKEKEEKRRQRMQLASSVLQTYLQNSQDPQVENPLAKTITDTILLTEFIKSLPTFASGIEDTGKNGQGVDGKGGFHAILHPNERVLTKQQNALVGNMSNEDLSKLAYNYQNGLVRDITDGKIVSNSNNGTSILVEKLDSLEHTIKNKPENNIELEQIIAGAMAIKRTTKQGNTTIYNRYRVN